MTEPHKPKVLMITGAGASHDLHPEIGLGCHLVRHILDRVNDRTATGRGEERYLSAVLMRNKVSKSDLLCFERALESYCESVEHPSIDAFLNEVAGFPEFKRFRRIFRRIGFFMILAHVLGYEQALKDALKKRQEAAPRGWLEVIRENMGALKSIDFITFNYDRIIEEYLKVGVDHVYGFPDPAKVPFAHKNDDYRKISKAFDDITLMGSRGSSKCNLSCYVTTKPKPQHVLIMGYAFDDLNNKTIGLHQLQSWEGGGTRTFVNIHADSNWKNRRAMAERVRSVIPFADVSYLTCSGFLGETFSKIKG